MRLGKKDRKQMFKMLEEMTDMIDALSTNTPVAKEPEMPRYLMRLLLDLRALHYRSYGKPPTNVNLTPKTKEQIFLEQPRMLPLDGMDRIFGMTICDEPNRLNLEMWNSTKFKFEDLYGIEKGGHGGAGRNR